MRNIKLTLEYDGTGFHGFQRQRRLRTVQGVLEERLARVLREPVKVIGAGRTDAGVHALGQVANFRTTRPVPIERLTQVLNAALPPDVKVQSCDEVEDGFHARRSALSRTYRYTVVERSTPSPLVGRYALIVPESLSVRRMAAAARPLLGRHDFRAFQASGSRTRTTERTVLGLHCCRQKERISVTVEADSFLYRMVRIIVRALLAAGRGELQPDDIVAALTTGRRPVAGTAPAPACGLCLLRVSYRDSCGRNTGLAGHAESDLAAG
jgi:tRNA pseudouridine38-40 synthase